MSPPARRRLDADLVRRGLAGTRDEARELVEAGRVVVGGAPALNPSRQVRADEPVVVLDEPSRFVTRAGEKLAGALEAFDLRVDGVRALDVGAAAGGFTDCLLQNGARHVVAVDVSYGQTHERIRTDERVEVRDRTNIRDVGPGDLGEPFDLVVADVSFISLRTVLPNLVAQARPGGDLVVLVKPQFEATREEASVGKGIIRVPDVWLRVLTEVGDAITRLGGHVVGGTVSPVRGIKGNVEFFLHAVAAGGPAERYRRSEVDLARLVQLARG